MSHEPSDAPVTDRSKTKYYVGLAIAIVVVGLLAVFVFPNLLMLTDEGPAVDDDFGVSVPAEDDGGLADVTE